MTAEPVALSARNPRLATLRRLSGRRRARLEAGVFVVEGPVAVSDALAAGAVLEEVFVDGDALAVAPAGDPLRVIVDDALSTGTPVWSLAPGVLAGVADTTTPQGLLAVAPRRVVDLDVLLAGAGTSPVLVLADVGDPGNAGTLVRSAEAAGAAGVVAAGATTDLFGPKAVRSAAGSVLRVPVAEVSDVAVAVAALHRSGRISVATVARGGSAPEAVDLGGPVAVLVGSEAHGLPEAVAARAHHRLTVPLADGVESLNVAVAGSVVLFEAARQRRAAAPGTDWTPDGSPDRLTDR